MCAPTKQDADAWIRIAEVKRNGGAPVSTAAPTPALSASNAVTKEQKTSEPRRKTSLRIKPPNQTGANVPSSGVGINLPA